MRPEIIPHLLEFSVDTWKVILYALSVGLGLYNGVLTYIREGKTERARTHAIYQAMGWAIGGIVVTSMWAIPMLVVPDAAQHGGLYSLPLHTYGFAIALGFMLASPVETPEEAIERFTAKPPKPAPEKTSATTSYQAEPAPESRMGARWKRC